MTARQFVLELGRAMHALGSPSYRVEDTMDACSRALGLEGAFFC
ncbi:MAG: threonine/serine exporter family protein, partial [Planctomycetes bacterium]|nr:threonine/serine exporter family protein [Planctomycetota bacterium]